MKFIRILLLFFFTSCINPLIGLAQEKENNLHHEDDPQKYNSKFGGIGPKVYILPPPKTEEELLTEEYALKKQSQYQIDSLLTKLNLTKELKIINTIPLPLVFENPFKPQDKEAQLIAAINYYKRENDENSLADWQNNLAVFYTVSNEINKAYPLFLESSKIKGKLGSIEDQLLILNNLALLEVKAGNNINALALYDQLLEQAKKSKNLDNQAFSYLAIAKLEARLGDFTAAHNSIIKKSIPLLHKGKNFSGVVIALNELASFKEMQKSDIEAKWIYLQAVDVAQKYKDEEGLAISFINLARLKNRIGDINLSIVDYLASKELAIKYKMEDLLMEIQDELGDTYLKLNDYQAAALALNEYQSLKTNLLNQHLNLKN